MARKCKDTLSRIVAFVLLFCMIVLVYLGIVAIMFFRKKEIGLGIFGQVDYLTAYYKLQKEYKPILPDMSDKEYKEFVENDIGLRFYIYRERDINEWAGLSYVAIRTIVIDRDQTGYQYCVAFTHEVIHIKLCIKQERYVCYETFKYLYESEKLHNVGVWYGLQQLDGYYSGEYDISGLIVNYLTNK